MTMVSSGTWLSTIATKTALPRGEHLIHCPPQRAEQIAPLGLPRGVETKVAWQPVPVLSVQWHIRVAPEVAPELGRHLEDDELIRPGREPALTAELPELARDGHQRVGSGLMSQVIQLRTGDPQPRPAPPDLPLRDPH